MSRPPRAPRVRSLLVVVVVVLGFVATSLARPASARTVLEPVVPRHGAPVWITPATSDRSRARIAFLHGMCMDVRATCERVRTLVEPHGVLACPTGNASCGGGADWIGSGDDKALHLDASLEAAWVHAGAPAGGGDVLVGFSRGAFVARDVAYARPGRYRALVLIGAAMVPDAARLASSGIERVVLASGDFDPARRTMERAAGELSSGGLPARFVRLGPVGHALPRDVDRLLGAHLAWAASEASGG